MYTSPYTCPDTKEILTFLAFFITFFITEKTPLCVNVRIPCFRCTFSSCCFIQEVLKGNGKQEAKISLYLGLNFNLQKINNYNFILLNKRRCSPSLENLRVTLPHFSACSVVDHYKEYCFLQIQPNHHHNLPSVSTLQHHSPLPLCQD